MEDGKQVEESYCMLVHHAFQFHNACEPETFFAVALEKRVYRLKYIPVFSLKEPNTLAINIQLSPEGEVSSGGCIPRREASRYISTALH